MKLKPCELVLVLNEVVEERLTVLLPQFRVELMELRYSDGRVLRVGVEELRMLDGALRSLGFRGRSLASLFWDSLQSACVIAPSNVSDLLELMEEYSKLPSPRDPLPKLVAVDTNILYNSTLTLAYRLSGHRPPILVSWCVMRELSSPLRKRGGSSTALVKLAEARRAPRALVRELEHAWGLETRRAFAALRERDRVVSTYPVTVTERRMCRGDYSIVEDYSRIRGCRVTLVTHDKNLSGIASTLGLPVLYLEGPKRDFSKIPLSLLGEMLYYLAVNYLVVEVRGERGWARAWSWWERMRDDEAEEGLLRVEMPPRVEERVESELMVLRRVEEALRGGER